MAFNMFSGFMVTRSPRAIRALGVFVSVVLAAVSCEKVPLLAPTGSTITLSTATSALGFNGTADISAQVLEAAGTPPHSGTHITFSTNLGTVEPAEVQTDVNGRATTRFRAGNSSGIATIIATSGGASVAAANAIKIAVGSAAVSGVIANANPAIVSSRGGSSTISAKVTDAGGNALSAIPVTFTTDFGSLSASVANTDASGTATVVLTTNRTAKVTATAGITTTTTTPPTSGTGPGTTTTTAPSKSEVTVAVNSTQAITIGTPSTGSTPPTVNQLVSWALTYTAIGTSGASAVVRVSVNWGDGRTENFTGQPPSISHAYSSGGSFLIVVTGFDALDDTSTASTSITVTAPTRTQPTVTVASSTTTPQVGSPVSFTITATLPSSAVGVSIVSIFVDYGDGKSDSLGGGSPVSVQHVFDNTGTYRVTATATDSNGQTGSGSIVIVVGAGAGPTASFTISPSTGGTTNTTFAFDASASTGTGLTYAWNFGDSTSGSGVVATHRYNTANTFIVTLTVTDNQGRTASASKTVEVTFSAAPVANFNMTPATGTTATVFTFDATASTGSGLTYSWNFGDNTALGSGVVTTHQYAAANPAITVTLTVKDNLNRTSIATKTFAVTP